jgi:outer membrane protein assembly factor BamB
MKHTIWKDMSKRARADLGIFSLDTRADGHIAVGTTPAFRRTRIMRLFLQRSMFLLLQAVIVGGSLLAADKPKITHDWPAYYGPDGTYADLSRVPILDDLSQAELVWTSEHADLGFGKSSSTYRHAYGPKSRPSGSVDLIVAGGFVIQGYFHPKNNVEADDVLLALDTATGQTAWKQVYANEGFNRAAGKHVVYAPTPVAYDGKVFFLGSGGRLHGVETATGKRIWDQDIEDFPARFRAAVAKVEVKTDTSRGIMEVIGPIGLNGAMTSPLTVVGGVLIVSGQTTYGFDPATGKMLWKTKGMGQLPTQVDLNGTAYALYGADNKVHLLDPKTGMVLWTEQREGAGMLDQAVPSVLTAEGRVFIGHPDAAKKMVLSAFAVTKTGLNLLWQTKEEFKSPGYFAYRDGVVYYDDCATRSIRTYRAGDGTLYCDYAAGNAPTYHAQFHVWGNRIVLIGDHCHESLWYQCTYLALTHGFKDLKTSGDVLYPRSLLSTSAGKYTGVCGYGELWSRPVFVDGYLFARGVNKESGCGTIFCWDLRALPEDARVVAAREAFAKGQQERAVKDLIAVLKGEARRPRADACNALAKMGQAAAPAGTDLARLMGDWWQPDGKAAFAALIALGTITENDVLARASDPSIDARRKAWQILVTVAPKSEATIAAARRAAVKEDDEQVRQCALTCLVSHGEAAVPILMAMVESPEEQRVGLTVLGMLGDKGKSALPKVLPLLEQADEDLCRFAAVAATKIAPEDRLPDTAGKWLKEMFLAPVPILGTAKCDYLLAARHLHRLGPQSMPVFVEACKVGIEKNDYYRLVRAAYGLSLYGAAAREHLPILEEGLKKFANHKDINGRIKPTLEKSIAVINGKDQVRVLETMLKNLGHF